MTPIKKKECQNKNKKIGILYQPKTSAAVTLAKELAKVVEGMDALVWLCSAWEEEKACAQVDGTRFIVCLGGDGTILRAARIASPAGVPIVGVNLGRVGFMTEITASGALSRVPAFIEGEGWVEERSMLQVELVSANTPPYHALNDVVVGRGERCRLIRVKATVDDEPLTTYKCDGVIIATATGSTGYALAAGGSILHPQSEEIVMKPIAAHLSLSTALVLPADATVELQVSTTHKATLSIDGQIEVPLSDGDVVRVRRSPYVTRLLKSQWPAAFYDTLVQKLEKRE